MSYRVFPRAAALAALASLAPLAAAQSNVRPVPVLADAPRASYGHLRAKSAREAHYRRLAAVPVLDETRWNVSMEIEAVAQPSAGLEKVGGDLTTQSGSWSAALTRELDDREWSIYVAAEATFFDWSANAPVVGTSTDPFNDLYTTRLGAVTSIDEDEELGWFTGMEVFLSGEDSADVQDAISVGGITGVRCRAGDDLAVSFGLAALTRLEDDAWVIPYFGFDWQVSDRLHLGTEGPRVALEAALSDDWSANLAAEYRLRQYRLNESNALADGVFQDDQITATAGLAWMPRPGVSLELEAGAAVWEEYTFVADGGTTVNEFESDPSAYVGLGLRFDL